jgi:hypothetical protein
MLLFVTSSPGDLQGDFWSRRVGDELGLEVAEEVCCGWVGEGSSMLPSVSAIDDAVDFLPVNQTRNIFVSYSID